MQGVIRELDDGAQKLKQLSVRQRQHTRCGSGQKLLIKTRKVYIFGQEEKLYTSSEENYKNN